MEENNPNTNEYRVRARQELDDKIKKFTSYLNAPEAQNDTPFTVRVLTPQKSPDKTENIPAVHDGHRKRMRISAVKDRVLESFSDVELLEYLLSFVIPRKDTNVTSHKLLDAYATPAAVLEAPPAELYRFSAVTENAASVIAALKNVCRMGNTYKIRLRSRRDVTDLFGAVYAAGKNFGMYVIFLDESGVLSAIEVIRFDVKTAARTVVQSAIKRNAAKVMMVWCDENIIGAFGLSRFIADLNAALDSVGVELTDFIMFIDYGYYTLCQPRRNYGGWSPQYVFIPEQKFAASPKALARVHNAADENSECEARDFAAQLNTLISRRSRK